MNFCSKKIHAHSTATYALQNSITVLSRSVRSLSPRPRKNRSCGTNPINQSSQSSLIVNQSINRKLYNESPRLIDWFNLPSEKLPHGDDIRLGPKSDRTPPDKYSNHHVFMRPKTDNGCRSKRSSVQTEPCFRPFQAHAGRGNHSSGCLKLMACAWGYH